MSADKPAPPIVPEHVNPKIEDREDIKKARVREIAEARRQVRETRIESARLRRDRTISYSKADANREYLEALKNFISELEPIYSKLGGCAEYWEADEGDPLIELERPPLSLSDILDYEPRYAATGGYPPVLNPEALQPEVLGAVPSLRELMEVSAEVPYSVELKLDSKKGRQSVTVGDTMVFPRAGIDRARRWCLDYCEEIGLSFSSNDERSRHVIGGDEQWEQ